MFVHGLDNLGEQVVPCLIYSFFSLSKSQVRQLWVLCPQARVGMRERLVTRWRCRVLPKPSPTAFHQRCPWRQTVLPELLVVSAPLLGHVCGSWEQYGAARAQSPLTPFVFCERDLRASRLPGQFTILQGSPGCGPTASRGEGGGWVGAERGTFPGRGPAGSWLAAVLA